MNKHVIANAVTQQVDFSLYKIRRDQLVSSVKQQFSDKTGMIVLFANLEGESSRFNQEKSFYYYTGINEPGTVLVIELDGAATLYVPNCFEARSQWMALPQALIDGDAGEIHCHAIKLLGDQCRGYGLSPFFSLQEYSHLIAVLDRVISAGGTIFTTHPDTGSQYMMPRFILQRLERYMPTLFSALCDISPLIAQARRHKDAYELDCIKQAVSITETAHESAAALFLQCCCEIVEATLQAKIESIMITSLSQPAFPSIVATGKNSTILHYTHNTATVHPGDVVVIDIGAQYNNYCADITRTYPASGEFTKRQREIYSIVLETQEYIAALAQPGYWLRNGDEPERSLHHRAQQFLARYGYDKYFPHGIGHFLGLDVHDVGDYAVPLQEGDVFTIEPGIYLPDEAIGIRIEDDYVVTKTAVECVSYNLVKKPDDVEQCMHEKDLLFQQCVEQCK